MLNYRSDLKAKARTLRSNQTDAEQRLWLRLRRKQLLGCTFNRQKPLDSFVVDFYCHQARLVVEVDGGQHFLPEGLSQDSERDARLNKMGLNVLRFSNHEVMTNLDGVLERILAELNPP